VKEKGKEKEKGEKKKKIARMKQRIDCSNYIIVTDVVVRFCFV